VHENDLAEPALLEEKISMLNKHDRATAQAACASACKALWDALTGIMEVQMN